MQKYAWVRNSSPGRVSRIICQHEKVWNFHGASGALDVRVWAANRGTNTSHYPLATTFTSLFSFDGTDGEAPLVAADPSF